MLGLVQPMVTLSIIVFEPETRIGEHLRVVQFAAPSPIIYRWAGVLGTVGWPGWLEKGRKEGRKERSGREVSRGGIYKKISQCQESS